MATLNKVILMGNVGGTPEIKTTAKIKIGTFSLCTTTKEHTKHDGTKVESQTEWHRIKAFGNVADVIEKYVHKGTALYIEGHLHYDSYEKDGKKVYTTDIIMDNFQFIGGKSDGGNNTTGYQKTNTPEDDAPF